MNSSFHQSMNASMANLSLNHSVKTPHHTPHRNRSTKTPSDKRLNKSGSRLAKTPVADRFVPDRGNFEMAHYLLQTAANEGTNCQGSDESILDSQDNSKKNSMYSKSLTENMLGVADLSSVRVLSYAQKPKAPLEVNN